MSKIPANHNPHSEFAFVALGSNLGDSKELVKKAMDRLQGFSVKPVLKSSYWKTTPMGCPPGSPDFVNAVVGLVPRAGETPESLLLKLQDLEAHFGRQPKKVTNEPRPLDLDLIAFGNETRAMKDLTLPHPRATRRLFVLQPLNEIAPDLILPGQSKTIKELLRGLTSEEVVRKLK